MECLKYIQLEHQRWDEYIAKIEGSTFSYTSVKINFDVEYSLFLKENESMILLEDNQPIAAVILYIEEYNGTYSVSWSKGYVPLPVIHQGLTYKQQEKIMKKSLEYIEKIAGEYGCQSILLRFDPLVNPANTSKLYNYNVLLKEQYQDKSTLTQMIDLRQEEKILRSEIRKGHKSDIKRGRCQITFYDKDNITESIIEEYKRIYELDAGKVTRNSEMYMHYYNFVKAGEGLVALANCEGENVAVLIATLYKDTAYYSSYAELTEQLQGKPAGHQLQWNTILELKQRGIAFYEIGEQVFGEYPRGSEEAKLVNISAFKRGFGGYTTAMFRGEKIFGKNEKRVK